MFLDGFQDAWCPPHQKEQGLQDSEMKLSQVYIFAASTEDSCWNQTSTSRTWHVFPSSKLCKSNSHSQKLKHQKPNKLDSSWWNPTNLKKMRKSNWIISPNIGVNISKKYLKPPPRIRLPRNTWCPSQKMFPLSPISVEVTANSMMNITALIRPGSCSCLWRFKSSLTISGTKTISMCIYIYTYIPWKSNYHFTGLVWEPPFFKQRFIIIQNEQHASKISPDPWKRPKGPFTNSSCLGTSFFVRGGALGKSGQNHWIYKKLCVYIYI